MSDYGYGLPTDNAIIQHDGVKFLTVAAADEMNLMYMGRPT